MGEAPGLSVLLSKSLMVHADEVNAERDAGAPDLAAWANVLRCLDESGVDQRDLPGRARLSKRAVPPVLRTLERSGHIDVRAAIDGARGKRVHLTALGRATADSWPPILGAAEKRWRRRFGTPVMSGLRSSLEALVAQLDLELAHFPAQYGSADPRIRGGIEWKPVPRVDGGDVEHLPLPSLLSQAFVALALDYEARSGPLQWAANTFRYMPDKSVPIGELPAEAREWFGTMSHHRFIDVLADGAKGRSGYSDTIRKALRDDTTKIRLTPHSRTLRDAYEPTLRAIEADWTDRYGADVVATLRSSLETIVAELDPDDALRHNLPM